MPPAGGKATPIDSGTIARVGRALAGGVRGAIKGVEEAWFGPQQPMLPVAQEVAGRQLDYPIGWNLQRVPRSEPTETGVSFQEMRAFADGSTVLRAVLETRKDQMEAQPWALQGRDGSDGGPRAREIEKSLRRPDGRRKFARWQRMLMEEMFVTDAAAIYKELGLGGIIVPQVIDGTTLKILMREDGRLPVDPDPAFQQQLHGMPAVDYKASEVIYAMRNPRVHKIYGFSHVEQIIFYVDIGLRRDISKREYYTAGSLPDAIASVPATWTPAQIKAFQDIWDEMMSGNTAERRRLRFVPGDVKMQQTKPDALKDEFDEWLARVICFVFSIPPTPFCKATNRATADTAQETAKEEGLEPVKKWWKEDVMDEVLEQCFNAPDLELAWPNEEVVDPLEKAQINALSLGGPGKAWRQVNEIRKKDGDAPLSPAELLELNPAPAAPAEVGGDGTGDGNDNPEPPAKVAKAARRSLRPRPPAGL